MKYDPKIFYKKIGAKGLASLASKEKTIAYIKFLKRFISQDHKILDVACGYGRITIPLAKMGYHIEGIDISPNLIEEAKKQAKRQGLKIVFKVGDMRNLPYKSGSFDTVICMWSSFSYMLTKKDQIQAINQMYRVLAQNGILIIDLPFATKNNIKSGVFMKDTILKKDILGAEHVVYLHTKKTLDNLLKNIKNIKSYDIKYQNIGGKRRLVAFIKK
ncbi:class I SAM-dependent methyltransferase [Candidatus Dependentiae bacterium]